MYITNSKFCIKNRGRRGLLWEIHHFSISAIIAFQSKTITFEPSTPHDSSKSIILNRKSTAWSSWFPERLLVLFIEFVILNWIYWGNTGYFLHSQMKAQFQWCSPSFLSFQLDFRCIRLKEQGKSDKCDVDEPNCAIYYEFMLKMPLFSAVSCWKNVHFNGKPQYLYIPISPRLSFGEFLQPRKICGRIRGLRLTRSKETSFTHKNDDFTHKNDNFTHINDDVTHKTW